MSSKPAPARRERESAYSEYHMSTCAHTQVRLSSPFPPSNSFLTESLGSGSDCGDDALASGRLALLCSRVWSMRQSSSCLSRSFQYSVSRERASQESVRASASASKAIWENGEKISCSHPGQHAWFHCWARDGSYGLTTWGKCSSESHPCH